jgi:hypothetical protein
VNPNKVISEVEDVLGEEWRKYHIAKQIARFVAGVVLTVIWAVHAGPGDWTAILPTIWSSMWVVAAQMRPQVPWSLVRSKFMKDAIGTPTPAPTAPPVDPAPPAKG